MCMMSAPCYPAHATLNWPGHRPAINRCPGTRRLPAPYIETRPIRPALMGFCYDEADVTSSATNEPQVFGQCRGALIGVGVFSAVINVLYLTGSFYMLQVYDRVIPSRSVPTLVALSALACVL